jgi:hypothetical protein
MENARPVNKIATGARILGERMKFPFLEDEFEEHSKGVGNYQDSQELRSGPTIFSHHFQGSS